jgi:hypothetical protein
MLRRSGDADRHVQPRRDVLAGPADVALLCHPAAVISDRHGASDLRPERGGQALRQRQVGLRLQAPAHGHDAVGARHAGTCAAHRFFLADPDIGRAAGIQPPDGRRRRRSGRRDVLATEQPRHRRGGRESLNHPAAQARPVNDHRVVLEHHAQDPGDHDRAQAHRLRAAADPAGGDELAVSERRGRHTQHRRPAKDARQCGRDPRVRLGIADHHHVNLTDPPDRSREQAGCRRVVREAQRVRDSHDLLDAAGERPARVSVTDRQAHHGAARGGPDRAPDYDRRRIVLPGGHLRAPPVNRPVAADRSVVRVPCPLESNDDLHPHPVPDRIDLRRPQAEP